MSNSSGPEWQRHWPHFERVMKKRLEDGYAEYGDGSFMRPIPETMEEVMEEMLDIIGWAFIAWCRWQMILRAVKKLDEDV